MKSLEDKTVLVTGASSGIGEAFARQFAQMGLDLILTARSGPKLNKIADELRNKYSVKVKVIIADLTIPSAPKELAREIWESKLQVDILVNNAGFGKWANFLDEDMQTYSEMVQLNIDAVVQLSHLFLPHMLQQQTGGIINIASTGSFQPTPFIGVYCATKAFVLSFSEALFGEYMNKGITITAVCPGNTQTSFADVANAQTDGAPFATPEQVAKEGISAFINNKNYVVTGGFGNYIQSLSSRFLPRKTIINIVANMFRNKIKGHSIAW
jgi:short-subunit dehydrogenase